MQGRMAHPKIQVDKWLAKGGVLPIYVLFENMSYDDHTTGEFADDWPQAAEVLRCRSSLMSGSLQWWCVGRLQIKRLTLTCSSGSKCVRSGNRKHSLAPSQWALARPR